MRVMVLLVVVGVLGGCASVDQLADTMNKRAITSCIFGMGTYAGVGVSILSATGGATLEDCWALRRP